MPSFSSQSFLDSVGVNIHLGIWSTPYYTLFNKVAPMLQDLGITHVRDNAVFSMTINYATHPFYQHAQVLAAAGIKFSLVCLDPLNGFGYTPPGELVNIFNECSGSVEMFEGSNEPSLTRNPAINPQISQDAQRMTYQAIKGSAILKTLPVASPSYIQGAVPLISSHAPGVCDLVNIHPYPGMEHPETTGPGMLSGFIAASKAKLGGYHPVVATENGYNTALQTKSGFLPVSEAIKARYLPRMLLWAFMQGVTRTYIYELIDSFAADPANIQANFGLADFNGVPKASYAAVKNLMSILNTSAAGSGLITSYTLTGDMTNVETVQFQRADGSSALCAWLGVQGWDPSARAALPPVEKHVVLSASPTPITITAHRFGDDGTETTSVLPAVAGGFDLTISDQLTILEIT